MHCFVRGILTIWFPFHTPGCTEADECSGDFGGHTCSGTNSKCVNTPTGYVCDCAAGEREGLVFLLEVEVGVVVSQSILRWTSTRIEVTVKRVCCLPIPGVGARPDASGKCTDDNECATKSACWMRLPVRIVQNIGD